MLGPRLSAILGMGDEAGHLRLFWMSKSLNVSRASRTRAVLDAFWLSAGSLAPPTPLRCKIGYQSEV